MTTQYRTIFYPISTALLLFILSFDAFSTPRILVFSKTAGFHHASIAVANAAIIHLGRQHDIDVDTTTNAQFFNPTTLAKYDAVVFLNTTGDVLNDEQQKAFEQFIESGKGFVGIHAAADTEYGWPWYGKLVGAYFKSHPKVQGATLYIVDKDNPATHHLSTEWKRSDEWYNFKSIEPDLHVLITLDETSYQGGDNGANHPVSWFHTYDGGRSFYTALGHTDESYTDPTFLKHILGGIQYAVGKKQIR